MSENKKREISGMSELDSELGNVSGGGFVQRTAFATIEKAAELSEKGVKGKEQQSAFDDYMEKLYDLNAEYEGKW